MTTQDTPLTLEPERRFRFDWLLPALFRPRATFAKIGTQAISVWLLPLLLLTVFAIVRSVVTGSVQAATLASQPIELPPDLPPEQAEQIQQQSQSFAANPLFLYVFPTALSVVGVWVGWFIVGGLLHLLLTLIGGRGSTRSALNVVAWASLPFLLRDLVRIVYMLAARSLIAHPGLSGFAPEGGTLAACAIGVFGQVDLYFIWHIILIALGVRASDQLPQAKAWAGAVVTVVLVALLQALPGVVFALLGAATSGGGF